METERNDYHRCVECGGLLAVEYDVETHECWGAAVSRRMESVVCDDCGTEELDPYVISDVVRLHELDYAQHIAAETTAWAESEAARRRLEGEA